MRGICTQNFFFEFSESRRVPSAFCFHLRVPYIIAGDLAAGRPGRSGFTHAGPIIPSSTHFDRPSHPIHNMVFSTHTEEEGMKGGILHKMEFDPGKD